MPAIRPSTRVQRRAQPFTSRSTTSRRRSPRTTAASTNTTAAEHQQAEQIDRPAEQSVRPSAMATSPPTTMGASLSDAALQQIVSAVSQAVLTSLNANSVLTPPTTSPEMRELPVVTPGIVTNSADATTQGQVASALQHVSGENFIQVSQPSSTGMFNFNSVSVAIDAQVSAKLKAKIWNNEFVDFCMMLGSHSSDTRYHLSVSSKTGSLAPTLSLEPTQRTTPISSIEVWTSAFQVFVGVYTGKYPMEAPALMKYGEVVRDLAARGGDWRFYDTQFRHLRQTNASEMPWGSTHWELWIRAQNFSNSRSHKIQPTFNNLTPSAAVFFVPRGFCRKFHRGTACQGCNFKHQCFKCGIVHPAIRCNFRPSRPGNNSSPSAARSRASNSSSN